MTYDLTEYTPDELRTLATTADESAQFLEQCAIHARGKQRAVCALDAARERDMAAQARAALALR